MGDAPKQARLDNWAMFVMSRLQVFFNKTDYCDLTLQFEGNVQLKVHRVIMNACTEYFQLLEQTCEVIDDVLIMPPDLQADVILPIVNFMYTGILEYQHSIYEKLYRTAELMNMSVLLKFLDAQRIKMKTTRNMQLSVPQRRVAQKVDKLPATLPGRKLPVWKRKMVPVPVQINPVKPYSPEPRSVSTHDPLRFDNTPKPTRFEWPDEDIKDIKPFDLVPLDSSFDSISYTSKPLLTQEEEMRATGNSVFDDLRQLPTSKPVRMVKDFQRETSSSVNVDMEDLKSYVKEQKIRSGLAEYEAEDPDDPDYTPHERSKRKLGHQSFMVKKPRLSNEKEKENVKETRIITTGGKGGDSKVDHSKIISEVFKKYPHLVNKNKNIRLKILAKNKVGDDKDKEALRAKAKPTTSSIATSSKVKVTKLDDHTHATPQLTKRCRDGETTWVCTKCTTNGEPIEFVLYYLYRKHMTDVHHKPFDVRDCKHCGAQYDKPLHMAYHMYMSHAVAPARNIIFPKCSQCAYVALDKAKMDTHTAFHAANVRHSQCPNCKLGYINEQSLRVHMQLAGHNYKNSLSFDCQYCTRQLNSASSLFVHLKTTHFEDAKKDGMLSLTECELEPDSNNTKIIMTDDTHTNDEASEVEHEHIVNDNVNETLPGNMGAFDIVVLDEQQQFILPDEPQQEAQIGTIGNQQGGFMTLPDLQEQTYNMNQADIASTDELVMVLTDHDYNDGNSDAINDNSNIVVLYSHPVEGQQNQFIATTQGNLMLNSETGLLELHNDAMPISTQGESIEMIQKEIESHVNATSALTTMATMTTTTTDSLTHSVTSHQEEQQMIDNEIEDLPETKVSIIAVEQQGTGQLIDTIEEIESITATDATDYGGVANVHPETFCAPVADELIQQPAAEPMEVDEDGDHDVKQEQNGTLSAIEETNEIESNAPEEAPPIDEMSSHNLTHNLLETAQCPPDLEQAEEAELNQIAIVDTHEFEEHQHVELPQTEVAELNKIDLLNTHEFETVQQVDLQLAEHPAAETEEAESQAPTTTIELSCEPENDMPTPVLLEASLESQESTDATFESTEENRNQIEESFHSVDEPMEVDGTIKSLPLLPEDGDVVADEQGPNETSLLPVAEVGLNGDHVDSELELTEAVAEQKVDEDVVDGLNSSEIQFNEEHVIPQSNNDSVVSDTTDGSVVQDVGTILEQVVQEVVTPEEDSTTPDDTLSKSTEEVRSVEEESSSEQQLQLQEEHVAKEKGISTLLNDWEDTDSQQSEQGKGTAVNKLINDWDDD